MEYKIPALDLFQIQKYAGHTAGIGSGTQYIFSLSPFGGDNISGDVLIWKCRYAHITFRIVNLLSLSAVLGLPNHTLHTYSHIFSYSLFRPDKTHCKPPIWWFVAASGDD